MMNHRVPKVVVVEGAPDALHALSGMLESRGYELRLVSTGSEALERIDAIAPSLVLANLDVARWSDGRLLAALRERRRPVPVIVVGSASDARTAVETMRAGAADYLPKPVEIDELQEAIDRVLRSPRLSSGRAGTRRGSPSDPPGPDASCVPEALASELAAENDQPSHRSYPSCTAQPASLEGLTGASPPMQNVYSMIKLVAPSMATVLITGQNGTGKGEVARTIHALSPRRNGPFVTVNCAALATSILESELFGHERGSFTGAERLRIGRFEQANGGTLFLDEIGEVPPAVQVKLLNVLQDRSLERVGGNGRIPLDVRVIAATNRNLLHAVEEGDFRVDLYYRLNVVQVEMPPLREREGDLFLLADTFLKRHAADNGKSIRGFSDAALAKLRGHDWPGNVRELENAIERAVLLCQGSHIEPADLPSPSSPPPKQSVVGIAIPGASMAEVERFTILKTLEATGGSTTRAAEILEVSVRTLQYRLHEYGLSKPRGRPPSEPPKPRG